MILDLLFYSTYKKIEKSGESSLLVLNSCAFLGLVLTLNVITFLVILEFFGISFLDGMVPKFGILIFAIITILLSALFLINGRFKKVLKHYAKKKVNIEKYSIGYYFISALFLIMASALKYFIA
jgi:hypothetical protein